MSEKTESCYDTERLKDLLSERLQEDDESRVLRHLGACPECQRALESVAADERLWNDLREHLSGQLSAHQNASIEHIAGRDGACLDRLIEYLGPTDRPDMLGRLGSYEICGLVGQGSTGIVVKAFDSALNRYVAIKILSTTFSHHGAARQRFEREARAAAAVSHEHVVPIYAVDEYRGSPYIVMQYVSGGSLQQRMERQGPLSALEVVRIGMQVSSGLAAAHAQGIVHRDVKPANVMLQNSVDRVMVTDFGLARVADEAGMTRSGVIAGTPQFMSPEQARGEAIDHRSDLFSLGSLMYAASTARPPFRADTIYGVMHRVCERNPHRIREINPEIPEWLEALIAKLMSKRREDRFDSAEQVQKVLSDELAYLQGPTPSSSPERWWMPAHLVPVARRSILRTSNRLLAAIAATFVAGAFVFGLADDKEKTPGAGDNTSVGQFAAQGDASASATKEITIQTDKRLNVFESEEVRTFAVEPGGKLTLDADLGHIEVATNEENQVKIEVKRKVVTADQEEADKLAAKHQLEFAPEGADVKVLAKFDPEFKKSNGPSRFRQITFRIVVPRTYNLNLKTAGGHISLANPIVGDVQLITSGGDIQLAKIDGQVRAETSGGNITVGDIDGPAELHTAGGNLTVGDTAGTLTAQTAGGNIQLGHVHGDVTADTAGGNITVENVEGVIAATTAGGNVSATISKQPKNDCVLRTAAGNIKVRLNRNFELNVEANTTIGEIKAPFLATAARGKPTQKAQVKLNGGGPNLTAKTSAGNIVFEYVETGAPEAEETTKNATNSDRADSRVDNASGDR